MLARLLLPEDFGLMAMALVLVGLGRAFADFGLSGALIQRSEVSPEERSSLYWLGLGAGGAIAVLLVAVAPLVGAMYREPRMVEPLRWVALSSLSLAAGRFFRECFLLHRA